MRKVIAFCGFESSGKSYSAKRLLTTMGFEKTSFANTLRNIAFKTIGIPIEEGMSRYDKLKQTELINGLNFRNILENLGSAVREYDEDFWARGVLKFIKECPRSVCIDDLRYPNEYRVLKNYCDMTGIKFTLIFCDFKGENYRDNNKHESALLAKFLKDRGYKDQDIVDEQDIIDYEALRLGEDNEGR